MKSPVKPSTVKMTKTAINRFKSPQQQPYPSLSPKRKRPPSAMTSKEMENAITKKTLEKKSPPREDKSTAKNGACTVKCKAEGTNVEFQFEKAVIVSKVLIKTPGEHKGPAGYDCFVKEEGELILIGTGDLENIAGEQIMKLESKMCRKLLCRFRMEKGQSSFKILDMKVDCKVV
jgi:hypothetical protein